MSLASHNSVVSAGSLRLIFQKFMIMIFLQSTFAAACYHSQFSAHIGNIQQSIDAMQVNLVAGSSS